MSLADFPIDKGLPVVSARKLAEFCDVFCEKNVFSVEQSRVGCSAKRRNWDWVRNCTPMKSYSLAVGAELAAELGAVSADHLLQASDEGINALAQAGVGNLIAGHCLQFKRILCARTLYDRPGLCGRPGYRYESGSCFTESIPLIAHTMNLSIEEALTAYTINGAAAVGRADKIGSLDVGKQDLVILYPRTNTSPIISASARSRKSSNAAC